MKCFFKIIYNEQFLCFNRNSCLLLLLVVIFVLIVKALEERLFSNTNDSLVVLLLIIYVFIKTFATYKLRCSIKLALTILKSITLQPRLTIFSNNNFEPWQ